MKAMPRQQWIREVVLPAFPKVFTSPEREITGLSTIVQRREEMTRDLDHALRRRRSYAHPQKQGPR